MAWVMFRQALRHHWRSALAWGVGVGVLNLLTMSFFPNMDALRQFEQLFRALPPTLMQAFGLNVNEQLTPDSFLASLLFTRVVLILAVYGVLAGASITANEEDAGIMNVLLAQPVARARIFVERVLAHAVLTALVLLLSFGGLLIGSLLIELEVNLTRQFEATFGLYPALMIMIVSTALLGVVLRRRALVLGVAGAFVLGSYFLDTLGAAISEGIMPTLRQFSFLAYNSAADVVARGIQWGDALMLLAVAVGMVLLALVGWQRRDVGL